MASGGSWNGKISRATVEIDFLTKELRHPHPVPLSVGRDGTFENWGVAPEEFKSWDRIPKNFVFWAGFARPIRRGNGLIFRRRQFKPDTKSDIHLEFGARRAVG